MLFPWLSSHTHKKCSAERLTPWLGPQPEEERLEKVLFTVQPAVFFLTGRPHASDPKIFLLFILPCGLPARIF